MVLEISMAEKWYLTAVGWKLPTSLHCLKNDEVDLDEVLIEFTFSFHLLFGLLIATCKASPVSKLTGFRPQKQTARPAFWEGLEKQRLKSCVLGV